jgi:hypothetical protein
VVSDIIPVDYVANSMLVAAFSQAGKDTLTVMNYGTGHLNPILWTEYYEIVQASLNQYPFKDQVFNPGISFE